MKNIIVGFWDATQKNDNNITCLYHNTSQEKAISYISILKKIIILFHIRTK